MSAPQLVTPQLTALLEQLHGCLRQETALGQRLYEVMAQEQSALQRMDTSSIQALAQEKARLLANLDQQLQVRQKLIPGSQGEGAIDNLISKLPEKLGAPLQVAVDALRELLLRCHSQNEINGRIISASRRSVERSLTLLRGHQPDAVLYTQQGSATRLGPARRVATA